nr:immunoglobulin light chain junction region [Macaca mulatta]MOW61707.1 immunoglobulin light chain junction region [Macaca mulatta]MOW61822.1 immunoglobulin light chain junction region [Macaca mulatta]MOW62202.1 immunoglobulin light chain junction region [Macaca mulatta]MOW62287.1 immunoglobulin light chain junction region [Macaca mulatta]
CQKYNTSPWTF